jgi:hypothetical protein
LVESRAVMDAELALHRDRGRREGVVRRRGRQHDEIDRLRIDARILERGARGAERKMRGQLALGRDMARTDAGALHDPVVGGLDHPREVVIRQDTARQIAAAAEDDGACHCHEIASPTLLDPSSVRAWRTSVWLIFDMSS